MNLPLKSGHEQCVSMCLSVCLGETVEGSLCVCLWQVGGSTQVV